MEQTLPLGTIAPTDSTRSEADVPTMPGSRAKPGCVCSQFKHSESCVTLRRLVTAALAVVISTSGAGCLKTPGPQQREVVVYTALDREFSEPIFREFTESTGIRVRAKYDTEANKTVGLTHLIMNQRRRPQCDVFWNNEILNTLRLQQANLLVANRSAVGATYPLQYRSLTDHWYGFAARARVLLVNEDRIGDAKRPRSILDLVEPKWSGEVGIAKPLFGTTATHAACLFAMWGESRSKDYFRTIRRSARVLPGNRQVAQAVGAGQLVFGLTDTDDAWIEVSRGNPVSIIYPDQESGGLGTLFIPNTLAVVQGGPNPTAASRLIDYLLAAETEQQLARGASAQIPLHPSASKSNEIKTPSELRAMPVDFMEAAQHWETVSEFMRDTFASAK